MKDEIKDEAGFLKLLSNDLKPFYEPRLPYHNGDEYIEQEMTKGKSIHSFMTKVVYMGHDYLRYADFHGVRSFIK